MITAFLRLDQESPHYLALGFRPWKSDEEAMVTQKEGSSCEEVMFDDFTEGTILRRRCERHFEITCSLARKPTVPTLQRKISVVDEILDRSRPKLNAGDRSGPTCPLLLSAAQISVLLNLDLASPAHTHNVCLTCPNPKHFDGELLPGLARVRRRAKRTRVLPAALLYSTADRGFPIDSSEDQAHAMQSRSTLHPSPHRTVPLLNLIRWERAAR